LPSDTVNFSSLTAFKHTIKCVDFGDFLNLAVLRTGIVYFTFVLLMFFCLFIFRATVSAVFQPCRTCYFILFVLHAHCVLHAFLMMTKF